MHTILLGGGDRRYWTGYDHFMAALEARAARLAAVRRRVGHALRSLAAKLRRLGAATSRARRGADDTTRAPVSEPLSGALKRLQLSYLNDS